MRRKRKNKDSQIPENILLWRKNFLLGKRKALRDKQKAQAENQRNKVFDNRLKKADSSKSLITTRTKAYYRWAEFYPSEVTPDGFRKNGVNRSNRRLGIILSVILCLLAFFLGFIFAETGVRLADIQPPLSDQSDTVPEETPTAYGALHIGYEELLNFTPEQIESELNDFNCRAALIELKNDYGYVYFNTGSFYGQSADRRIPDVMNKVNALIGDGYEVWASICCYKDSCAPVSDLSLAVRKNTSEGGTWTDNNGNAYLNPYSNGAKEYLLSLISFADENGFSRIILSDVAFPGDSGVANAYFPGESDSAKTRNDVLTAFINSAIKSVKNTQITLLSQADAFDPNANKDTRGTHGSFLNTSAASLCLDARFSTNVKNVRLGDRLFKNPSSLPYVFVLTAGEWLKNAVLESAEKAPAATMLCIDKSIRFEQAYQGVVYSKCDGYIIW